jgi:Flp pilus assembly protein TadG
VRNDRLLKSRPRRRGEEGSAAVESTFALVLLLILVLGTIEVAFALYGRNVVLNSAHEAARAAVELGRTPAEAEALATATVERAAGGLTDELRVEIGVSTREVVTIGVRVDAVIDPWGPIPFRMPVRARATATRELVDR